MVTLDGHANTEKIAKNRNRGVSTMGTVPIVVEFAIVPIISMELFAKIKTRVSACLVKRIKLVFYTRIQRKNIAVKTRIEQLKALQYTCISFCITLSNKYFFIKRVLPFKIT